MVRTEIASAYVEIDAKRQKHDAAIRKLKTNTTSTIKKLQANWDKYSKTIRRVGIGIAAMGTAATGALVGLALHAAKTGDEFHKMSLRVGESSERLSALAHAAKISGVGMAEIETGIRRLSQHMNDFQNGIGEAKDTFEALGIEVVTTDGKLRSSLDVMNDVADELNKLTSESQKVAYAQELFGRAGSRLLPMLKEGSVGIKALTDEAARLGLVIDTKAAAAAADFNDRLTDLRSSVSMVAMDIGMTLIPILQPLVERFTEIVVEVKQWTKEHKTLTDVIAKFGLVLAPMLVVGGSLMILAPAITGIAKAVVALKIALLAVNPLIGGFAIGLGAVGIAWKVASDEGKKWVEANKGLKSTIKTEADLVKALGDRFEELEISLDALGFGEIRKEIEELGKNTLGLYNAFGKLMSLFGKEAVFVPPNLEEARKEMDLMAAELGRIGRPTELRFAPAKLPDVEKGVKAGVIRVSEDLLKAQLKTNREREKAFEESWKATVDTVEGAYAFMKKAATDAARGAINEKKRQADEEFKAIQELGDRIAERRDKLYLTDKERLEKRVRDHIDAEKKILAASEEGLRKYWEAQITAQAAAAEKLKESNQRMVDDMQQAISFFIQDVILEFDNLGDVIKSFFANLASSFVRNWADMVAVDLLKEQQPEPDVDKGPIGGIVSVLKELWADFSTLPKESGFAAGGITPATPTLAMVGERGREAVVPLQGGKIPVELKGGGGSLTVNIARIEFPNASLERMDEEQLRKVLTQRVAPILSEIKREGIG